MDTYAQYLKYKKKYQRLKSFQKGGDITNENEIKMNKEIQQVNEQYNAYSSGRNGYSTEIDAAKNYEIEQIKHKYSSVNKSLSTSGVSPTTVTFNTSLKSSGSNASSNASSRSSSLKSSLDKGDALREIYNLINKQVNLDSPSKSPQDAYDKGFISAQLVYLTGNNTVAFENNPELNPHYVAGYDDGETAAEIKERGSNKYIHIYRDDYSLPNPPSTPQSAIITQAPPRTLPREATDKIKAIEAKYTGPNGLLTQSYGPGTDAILDKMDEEISQIIREYISK